MDSAETMPLSPTSREGLRQLDRSAATPQKIGRFEIVEVLGSGGFGTVYRADDPLLDRQVALKVPRLSDDERQEEFFLHEAKAAARLRHPNIVAVFECGVADNRPYIASEFVDGETLATILKASPLETRQAVDLVRQISEAIDYAHSEGIVHRDLKPDNIMIDGSFRPQVMDFGLARLSFDAETSLMSEGSIVGTPSFMSPEQARGEKEAVGPKSDQYSLGVLLYLMLCGSLPYDGKSWSIISSVANPAVQPKTPRALRADIPRDLEACCMKAMEKDPNRRYERLGVLADDLNRWLEGRPLIARPISAGEQLRRWCRRNRAIASLLGVITGFIFVALIAGYLLAYQFSNLADYANERADAEQKAKLAVEQLLIDTYTESGLQAGRHGRHQEAVLWFANSVALSGEHPRRERMNRARFHAWLRQTPVPVRMFRGFSRWHKSLVVHPSGQFILSEQRRPIGDHCQIWRVESGQRWELPWDPEQINAAAWNDEGNLLAMAAGKEVRTFEFPEGTPVDRWQNADHVNLLAFSPRQDRLAVAGYQTIHLRDLEAAEDLRVISTPSTAVVVCWNPDGDTLAALCDDEKVYAWPAGPQDQDGRQTPAMNCPFQASPPELQFIDTNLIVVPESGVAVRCWDVSNGQTVWTVPCSLDAQCRVSADRKRVAILDKYRIRQVDAADGSPVAAEIEHPNLVYDAMYDPSGRFLLTGCADQFARVFSAESGEMLSSIRHGDMVHRVVWFPNSQACVTAHWEGDLVRVWNLGVKPTAGFAHQLHGGVMDVKWNGNGSRFLPCGMDVRRAKGAPRVRSVADGHPVGPAILFPGRASDGCFLPGTPNVLYGGSEEAGEEGDNLRDQDLSRPGLIVAANMDTGESVFPPIRTESNVVAVEASPDGHAVFALCHDRSLLVVDPRGGSVLQRHETFPNKHFMYGFAIFRRMIFSPTGDRFAIWGSQSRTVEVRSGADGSLLFAATPSDSVNSNFLHNVVFAPDGKSLVTCSSDQTVRIYDAEDGKPVSPPLVHGGWVFSAEFSHDGKRLLTACQDRQARLWDLADVSKPLLITPAQSDEVYATCFLPGEEFFLIGLRNGTVSVWDAEQGKMISPATTEPNQKVTYTLALSPDQSRVIVVGREPYVSGYPPSRWQPAVEERLSRGEIRLLGETIASQELFDGVLTGASAATILENWEMLFARYANHEIFRWQATSESDSENR